MRALLDTHSFLWAAADEPRLSQEARRVILDLSTDLLFSAVTAWEIAIKFQMGKLRLPSEPGAFIREQMSLLRLTELPVGIDHAVGVSELPMHHKDPFDRLLVAQAVVERVPIITGDPQIGRYGVQVIW